MQDVRWRNFFGKRSLYNGVGGKGCAYIVMIGEGNTGLLRKWMTLSLAVFSFCLNLQDTQRMHDVILRRVRITIFAVDEK